MNVEGDDLPMDPRQSSASGPKSNLVSQGGNYNGDGALMRFVVPAPRGSTIWTTWSVDAGTDRRRSL